MRATEATESGVPDDLLCIRCGYRLRGLEVEGRCPECGSEVACSMPSDRLSVADPSWLDRVYRGEMRIILGSLMLIGLPLVVNFILAFYSNLVQTDPFVQAVPDGVTELSVLPGMLRILFGTIGVTTIDPRLTLTEQPLTLRRAARVAAVISTLLLVFLICDEMAGGMLSHLLDETLSWVNLVVLLGVLVVISNYLAWLADRIPDPRLAGRTRFIAKSFAVCVVGSFLLGMSIGYASGGPAATAAAGIERSPVVTIAHALRMVLLLAVGVFLIAMLMTFSAYGKELHRCLEAARGLEARDRECTGG